MAETNRPADLPLRDLLQLKEEVEAAVRERLAPVSRTVRMGRGWSPDADTCLSAVKPWQSGVTLSWSFTDEYTSEVEEEYVTWEHMEDLDALFMRVRESSTTECDSCSRRPGDEVEVGETCRNCGGTYVVSPVSTYDNAHQVRLVFDWVEWQEDEAMTESLARAFEHFTDEQMGELEPRHLIAFLENEDRDIRLKAQLALGRVQGDAARATDPVAKRTLR